MAWVNPDLCVCGGAVIFVYVCHSDTHWLPEYCLMSDEGISCCSCDSDPTTNFSTAPLPPNFSIKGLCLCHLCTAFIMPGSQCVCVCVCTAVGLRGWNAAFVYHHSHIDELWLTGSCHVNPNNGTFPSSDLRRGENQGKPPSVTSSKCNTAEQSLSPYTQHMLCSSVSLKSHRLPLSLSREPK